MDRHDRNLEAGTRRAEADLPPQAERKHPSEWDRDLNPDRLAGQNIGIPSDLPTAYDFKELHTNLTDFENDELRQIPLVPSGGRLRQGATYLDLCNEERREFTASDDMAAGPDERLVPKSEVPYTLWNRLRGIDDPERTT